MTPELVAAGTASSIGVLERSWTTDPDVLGKARSLELSAWTFHLAGRGGVLGNEVHPETLAAALGTVAPDAVRAGWAAAQRVGPTRVAAVRLAACAHWGAEHLVGVDERLAALLERVLAVADPTAMSLFAATRRMAAAAVAEPSQAPGDSPRSGAVVALRVHALAEYRYGAMLVACRAVGLTPVEALIAGPEGEQEAIASGWNPPFPPRLAVLRRYAAAGALADRITGGAYAALDPAERVELVGLLRSAAATAGNG